MTAKLSPDTTHRVCTGCKECKPLDEFMRATAKPLGRSYFCRPCHRAKDAAHKRMIRAQRGPVQRKVPVVPLYPMPRMDLCEQLQCVQLRKWRGPVNEGPLVPALGWIVPELGRAA